MPWYGNGANYDLHNYIINFMLLFYFKSLHTLTQYPAFPPCVVWLIAKRSAHLNAIAYWFCYNQHNQLPAKDRGIIYYSIFNLICLEQSENKTHSKNYLNKVSTGPISWQRLQLKMNVKKLSQIEPKQRLFRCSFFSLSFSLPHSCTRSLSLSLSISLSLLLSLSLYLE